jgi:hypothetical protein
MPRAELELPSALLTAVVNAFEGKRAGVAVHVDAPGRRLLRREGCDRGYNRDGTLTLLAGIDL